MERLKKKHMGTQKWTILVIQFLVLNSAFAQSLNDSRINLILQAFNAKPANIVKPLVAANVELGTQDGRVNVNTETKFSYYVHIEKALDPHSRLILIPMATSRFTPTYYQSDDWWDAHKDEIAKAKSEGRPMPRQDMNEVAEWLVKMKLNTNPDVIVIDPAQNQTERITLQKFLLQHYLKFYAKDGYITLFRGAEKVGEIDSWNRRETPRGVRYWTPTANYAWRYARKNLLFLDELLIDKTPLFKFKVPVKEFTDMVERKWQHLTLGTELTKNAHQAFGNYGSFQDHLHNSETYMGEGRYGVEFELRSNRAGAERMTTFYQGPATIADLVSDRIEVLDKTMKRMVEKNPENADVLKQKYTQRIQQVEFEGQLLTALKENYPNEVVLKILEKRPAGRSEIANIDGIDFNSWVQKKVTARNAQTLKVGNIEEFSKEVRDKAERLNPLKMKCSVQWL